MVRGEERERGMHGSGAGAGGAYIEKGAGSAQIDNVCVLCISGLRQWGLRRPLQGNRRGVLSGMGATFHDDSANTPGGARGAGAVGRQRSPWPVP